MNKEVTAGSESLQIQESLEVGTQGMADGDSNNVDASIIVAPLQQLSTLVSSAQEANTTTSPAVSCMILWLMHN